MNNQDSVKIVERFYEAFEAVKQYKLIRGTQTFTNQYDINRRNFLFVKRNPQSDMFQMAWITYLVKDFGVSALWIMTGKGQMFDKK